MAKPSACGWPDETNTGVRPGTTLTVRNGDLTINQQGAVISNMDIRGCVVVAARDVTIRNSRITCDSWRAIIVKTGRPQPPNTDPYEDALANLLVEDVEIVMGSFNMKGIAFWGYTARRVHFHGGADCATFGRNVVIEDSFCDIPAGGPADGPHYDGFEDAGGNNVVIRHNTIRVPYGQTSPINADDSTNIRIVNNLVAGGGYAIYCPSRGGGTLLEFSGNVISKRYFSKGGFWGPVTGCPSNGGWRWDST